MLTKKAIQMNISGQTAVIVPVYNTGKYKLTKCIQSILAQSYQQFILILVDDGSTDDSGQVCDYFAHRDSRVKFLIVPEPEGLHTQKTATDFKQTVTHFIS